MSRQRARQQVGVALFPFLAVLICTMGALIVLLVLLVQQARIDATQIAEAKASSQNESEQHRQLRERLEDAKWRQELLEKNRAERNAELSDSRAKLAHLEDHARRLAEKARQLLEQAKAIDEGRTLRDDELENARSEAARLQKEIAQQKRAIESQQKQRTGSKDSYALIPYEGRSGTRRRPIYVECTEFGVIIQPEGLLLRPQDFMGPLGPGNPLDMALRATREYLESTLGSAAGQPYPLIVVRPGGVLAYERAKAAMKAWDDEFGYELISDELALDFGSPDPALSARLDKTVADARGRQAAMIAMMPRRYQEPPLVSAATDEPAAAGSRGGFVGNGRGSGVGGSGVGGGNVGGGGSFGSGSGGTGMMGSGPDTAAGSYGSSTPGGPGIGAGSPTGSASRGGGFQPGTGLGGTSGQPTYGGSAATGSSMGQTNAGSIAGGKSGAGSTSSGAAAIGQPGSSASAGSTSTGSSSMGGSSMNGSSNGTPVPSVSFGDSKTPKSSSGSSSGTASKSNGKPGSGKGKNWALPNAKTNHIGVSRPIRATILADRIVLAHEDGVRTTGKVVPVAPELTHDDVQQVVSAVQREVEGWGLAVADGYWKPVLQAEVAPEAERHFQNLQTALGGSGIEINRR